MADRMDGKRFNKPVEKDDGSRLTNMGKPRTRVVIDGTHFGVNQIPFIHSGKPRAHKCHRFVKSHVRHASRDCYSCIYAEGREKLQKTAIISRAVPFYTRVGGPIPPIFGRQIGRSPRFPVRCDAQWRAVPAREQQPLMQRINAAKLFLISLNLLVCSGRFVNRVARVFAHILWHNLMEIFWWDNPEAPPPSSTPASPE